GGLRAKPGEVSLAHNGVLFLDELPEFTPQVLDSLRQPLESGETAIARANYRVTFPSRFQLIGAMNPCRCGMAGEPGHTCRRGERCMSDYQQRISGPFMDRIDIRVEVPAITASDMLNMKPAEDSASVAKRVLKARTIQASRLEQITSNPSINSTLKIGNGFNNASASASLIEHIAIMDEGASDLIKDAAEKMKFSARAYHRILKVARTIADLEDQDKIGRTHLAEAIGYRAINSRLNAAA
ncbi:MAG: ATP-binding protein, partial [Nitratireductor sp.]